MNYQIGDLNTAAAGIQTKVDCQDPAGSLELALIVSETNISGETQEKWHRGKTNGCIGEEKEINDLHYRQRFNERKMLMNLEWFVGMDCG